MKYIILFCLLFSLTNCVKEFKPKFSNEKSLIMNNYDSNTQESICVAETKNECKALPNPDKDNICCYFERKINDEMDNEYCSYFPYDVDKLGYMFKLKEYKAIQREEIGHDMVVDGENYPQKAEETVTCKKGVYSRVIEANFNEKEKNILKDKNHCVNIYYKKYSNYNFDVGECKDHIVLDSSKEAGVECGSLVYNITLESKRTISYKTCILFSLNLFSYMNKINNLSIFSENIVHKIINSMGIENDNYVSFTVETYNSKGQKIKYDSKTNKVIIEGAGYNITASKYLFLLILILF